MATAVTLDAPYRLSARGHSRPIVDAFRTRLAAWAERFSAISNLAEAIRCTSRR